MGSSRVAVTQSSDIPPVSSKEFVYIKVNKKCEFALKCVRNMTITYSQMHRRVKYSQFSSVIW